MHSEQELRRAIELAARNVQRGVIQEPRVYFERLTVPTATSRQWVRTDPDIFRNGEDYPVRIHALAAAVGQPDIGTEDERRIQRVGLRTIFHGAYYMRNEFVALPLWQTRAVGAATPISFGQSSWRLRAPFVLSARDAMLVDVQLRQAFGQGGREATVSFSGLGMDSRRPYFRAASRTLLSTTPVPLDPEELRNDGDEPVLITDVGLHCSARLDLNNPQGDITQLNVQVQQNGNGTNAEWFVGAPGALCPAVLCGLLSGRALVHHFPGEGLLWEPGEGLELQLNQLSDGTGSGSALDVDVALIGTIEVV